MAITWQWITNILLSPINVVIEFIGLISAIIGIIRLDINKKDNKE